MRLIDSALEVGARVDARRGMPLGKEDVGIRTVVAAEEMIEADLIQRGRRRVRRDVPANALFCLVRPHDHRRRIPSDEALDAALHIGVARHQRVLVGRNRVDVRRVGRERQLDAAFGRVKRQLTKEARDFDGAAALQNIIKGIEPFAGFDGIELCGIFRNTIFRNTILRNSVFRNIVSHGNGFLSSPRRPGPESRHAGTSSRLVDRVGWPAPQLSVNH